MGCGRHFCPICGEEFIHRDHRHGRESSSALGQIIYREGPINLSVADIDIISLKRLKDKGQLLRVIEHKEPDHNFKDPQKQILKLLADIISHCCMCVGATGLRLDRRSGVFLMFGLIEAATPPGREPIFKQSQKIERLNDGQKKEFQDHESFFQFLDPEDKKRR